MTQPDISEGWAAGESVTAQKLNRFTKDMFDWLLSHREPQVYTPQLIASTLNPNLGSTGTATGLYWRDPITGWVHGHFLIAFGGAGVSAGEGTYIISLPTPARGFQFGGSAARSDIWGMWTARDQSTTTLNSRQGLIVRSSTTSGPGGVGQVILSLLDGSTTFVNHAAPFAWADGDTIAGTFSYPEPLT